MDPLTIMALSAGVQAASAGYRNMKAQKGLRELERQRMPQYMDAAGPLQQNLAMARRQYEGGLNPQAIALARGTAAGQTASQLRSATDLAGGQLGSAIGRIGAMNTNQLGLQLGAQDQMARERGMQQMMGVNQQLTGLQQRDIGVNLQRRMQAEQGYGQAIQDSRREMIGAATGLATGYLGYKSAEANRDMYRDIYGLKNKTQTPASTFNLVNPANTFKMAGPQTFNQYLAAGVPAGTTTDGMRSFAPGYQAPPSPINTPFAAPSPTLPPSISALGTAAQGAQLKPTVFGAPQMPNFPINPNGTMPASNTMTQPYSFNDMSGDPFYQSVYNPNVLRFSNPYNMNRGFMNSYDAVQGPYGQIMFKPN